MNKLFSLVLLATSTTSLALPTYYSKHTNLKNTPGITSRSTLLGDTDDPNTVWVLPPNAGKVRYKGYAPSGNLRFCEGMKKVVKRIERLQDKLSEIDDMIEAEAGELKRLNEIVKQKRNELAKHVQNPHIKEITLLEGKSLRLTLQIEKLTEQLSKTENPKEIEILDKRIRDLQTEEAEVKRLIAKLSEENREAYLAYTIAKQELDAAKTNAKSHNDYLLDLMAQYSEIEDTAFRSYARYVKFEGAIVHVDYDSRWKNEVNRLSETYSNLNFREIPTYNSRVTTNFANATDKDSYFESLPMLLRYNINGQGYLPYGERKEKDDPNRGKYSFPENVGVDLTLNLVGACPIVDPDYFDDTDFEIERDKEGIPKFALSAVYEYDVAYQFEVDAKFNLWSFYEKIVTQGTRGGLFSSKSYVNVLEHNFSGDQFEFNLVNEGNFPPQAIKDIKSEIKAELMNRVLTTIAEPKTKNQPKVPTPGTPPEIGAVVIAEGLNKVCGISIYCQVGSWVFKIAGSIWGNKETQTKMQKRWDVVAKERWNTTTMAPKQAIVTYKR